MTEWGILSSKTLSNRWLTGILRILVGSTFIYSGFVKGIDPWGTIYKVNDYLGAMGLHLWPNLVLVGVFALFSIEFLVGVFVLTGCFRRTSAIAVNLIMWFMLPLTLWIAIKDPVADCGCFGDAFIISNWATFWKNVVLTVAALWLLFFNKNVRCLVNPNLQWFALLVSGFYIGAVGIAGYFYQPLIDFRQYKVGGKLISDDFQDDGRNFVFVYEKDGKKEAFGMDDELPDENQGWRFVERKEIENSDTYRTASGDSGEEKESKERTLRLWDDEEDDVTEDVVREEGYQLILFMPDLGRVSIASTWQINSLFDWAKNNGIDMIAVVSGSDEEIEEWKDLSMPPYPIFQADDTAIKEVARGNPAVVMTCDGLIKWKSSLRALDVDDFLAPGTSQDPMSFARDNKRILTNVSLLYVSVMIVLICLSFIPMLRNAYRLSKLTRDGKAHHEESSSHDKSAQ